MATVYPFRGYRYNSEKVGDIGRVVTQPYDKIDEEAQEDYYDESPYNIVRLILNRDDDPYGSSAGYLNQWIDEETLIRDEEPSLYMYFQEYELDGEKKVRKGFVGLGELTGGEEVKAHEDTMEGPKADRLNLMRATEANFGHIFMLYSDPDNHVDSALADMSQKEDPLIEVKDEDRNTHKLWRIGDGGLIDDIRESMIGKSLYIADGHHRYETALTFKKECEDKGWKSDGCEGFDNRMMTFINIDDPGLTTLATHRLIYGLDKFNPRSLLEKARSDFGISRLKNKKEMYEKLDRNKEGHVFGYKARGDDAYWVLTLKDESVMEELMPEKSEPWRKLDVSILHKVILEKYFGIDEEALAKKENIDYSRYRDSTLEKLKEENYQAAFILNPTRVEEVKEIADRGERMPQKSTDFYPKLLTGLVLHKLAIKKE